MAMKDFSTCVNYSPLGNTRHAQQLTPLATIRQPVYVKVKGITPSYLEHILTYIRVHRPGKRFEMFIREGCRPKN